MIRPSVLYSLAIVILVGFAFAGGVCLYTQSGPSDTIEAVAADHSYNAASWEVRHLPGKWLYKIGEFFRSDRPESEDETLREYFVLGLEQQAAERSGDVERLSDIQARRDALRNRVEDILEGRITALLETQGLTINPPIFSEMNTVFPPVDFALDFPPRVLAISPRSSIRLDRSYLLSPGIDAEAAARIETQAESPDAGDSGISALVISAGGVATYPSVVPGSASYPALAEVIIHEWLHQYLALHPLGRAYFSGDQSRTLNETVANVGGRELARLFLQEHPLPDVSTPPASAPAGFDFNAEMRALRIQVDELLSAGRIEEAEALMERKRDEFETRGRYIRRINQAYFAFHGSYADTPASIDPIGPKVQKLFEQSASPGDFIRRAAQITGLPDLDRLLEG